jgi:hypothetical protein
VSRPACARPGTGAPRSSPSRGAGRARERSRSRDRTPSGFGASPDRRSSDRSRRMGGAWGRARSSDRSRPVGSARARPRSGDQIPSRRAAGLGRVPDQGASSLEAGRRARARPGPRSELARRAPVGLGRVPDQRSISLAERRSSAGASPTSERPLKRHGRPPIAPRPSGRSRNAAASGMPLSHRIAPSTAHGPRCVAAQTTAAQPGRPRHVSIER